MSAAEIVSTEYHGCRLLGKICGRGTPVVFIQGVGVQGDAWLPQVDALAGHYRCLTFDNRGLGASQPIAGKNSIEPFGAPITVEQMASDTLAIMDAAAISQAHLAGHSLGGLIALHLALTARQRVRSLSLLCTFADGRVATRMTWRMFCLGTGSRIGPRSFRRKTFLRIVMPPAELAKSNHAELSTRLAALFGHDLADHPSIVSPQLNALKNYNATPRLIELTHLPTLILSAAHDPIARPNEGGRVLASGIPGSRYMEFPHASHGLPIQCAGEVNALLLEHFQSAGAAQGF